MPELALTGYGIAITRPAGQANKLTESILAAGGKPFLFPLIAIAPLNDYSTFEQKLTDLPNYNWAIFISSNAVQNAMPRLLDKLGDIPKHLKFAAIGPTTASELAAFGVKNTLIPQHRFDSEALLALPEMQHSVNKRIMIFRGVGGRELLADTLKSRGATVDFAECYQRINPQIHANTLAIMWQNKQLNAIVVTSSEAMRHLLDMTDNGRADWIKNIVLCVNHARIAEVPQQLGLLVAIAEAPGDEAMLQCLSSALNP
jgi:uroporphyrinogen-III synthase